MAGFLEREPPSPVQANFRILGVETGQPGTAPWPVTDANLCPETGLFARSATYPSEYITFEDPEDQDDSAAAARTFTSDGLPLGSGDFGHGPIVIPDVPTFIPKFGRARGMQSRSPQVRPAAKSWLEGREVREQTRPWHDTAPASWATSDVPESPSAGLEQAHVETTAAQAPLHALPGGSGDDLAVQMRINKALTSAAKSRKVDCISKVLRVAATNLHMMNGVNLATAIHRLARTCQGAPASVDQVTQDPVFKLMLEMAEWKGQQELQLQDSSMPGNCCTIITWSCAVLRFFVPSLLVVLARVAGRSLAECQSFEITNMLWGFAELCKREPQTAAHMEGNIQELVDATARVMMARGPGSWKVQVLISALVSITAFPFASQPTARLLLLSIVQELTERNAELETANSQPVTTACHILRLNHPQVFDEIMNVLSAKRSSFLTRVVRDGNAFVERQGRRAM